MNPDDLAKILDELGQRLGPAGAHVFELAVRQVYINAIQAAVLLAVTFGLTIYGVPRIERWRTAPDADTANGRDFVILTFGIVWAVALGFVLLLGIINITAVFNPEYAAIKDILSRVTGTVR